MTLLAAATLIALGACKKTEDGGLVVEKPTFGTTLDTIHPPTVEMRTDTINAPVVGTEKDTLIVNKPVVGSKKTEVKVPTVKKPPELERR
jgi:hypothetical protein